ncbi:Low temperature viability protein-domain-containing protein [Lactifluus volemus]|nr:Low temperature viability protein-domain-containing protein [Lactifluus volemus]
MSSNQWFEKTRKRSIILRCPGKSRADLEASLSPSDLVLAPGRSDIGEASLYGVYFDDTEYDYMQHLRPVGEKEEGFESILLEAPKKQSTKEVVLPSASELPRDFDRQAAISSSISGLQPDMDPHLRQTLEALDDDAFVDDGLDDEFFGELIKDGERDASAPFDYEFKDDDAPTDGSNASGVCETDDGDEAGWEARFALFKKEQKGHNRVVASPPDSGSEDVDTVGQMPEFSAMRGRYSRGVASDASGFSISSSSIFRSDGLRDLDDRFDQIEKEYIEDEGSEDEPPNSDDSESAPELITSREDFDSLMDDFLHNYEVSGGKMKPSLHGSGPEKLQSLRVAMGRDERVTVEDLDQEEAKDDAVYAAIEEDERRERWDVETVLTTYTNLENHPRLIKAREERKGPKIRLDPKTGFPLEVKPTSDLDGTQSLPVRKAAGITARRPRKESAEERKERKRVVKAGRQARRVEKKEKKEQFTAAIRQQSQALARIDAKVRTL